MRRVTSKQKRAKESSNSSRHLVFSSEKHAEDRKAADRLRSMPRIPRVSREPFPAGKQIAFQGHFGGEKFLFQGEEDFVKANISVKNENSWYYSPDKRRSGGKGRKTKTGVMEVNVALPVGQAMLLSKVCEQNPDCRGLVQEMLLEVAKAGMAKAEALTGYRPVYMALHPDSEGVLSFHLGLSPVDTETRRLLGISGDGRKGRKGLRLLGDAFMSILRHSRYVDIPQRLMILPKNALEKEGRTADWEIGLEMEKKMVEVAKKKWPGFEKKSEEYGKSEAEDWVKRAGGVDLVDLLQRQVADLMIERDQLRERNEALERRVEKLEKTIEAMRIALGGRALEMA